MNTYAQRSEQTFDDYISAHVTDNDNVEYEVCFGLYHGSGYWDHWQDTGYEFVVEEEVELIFQDAFCEGDTVTISQDLIDSAKSVAHEIYWSRYADGQYN